MKLKNGRLSIVLGALFIVLLNGYDANSQIMFQRTYGGPTLELGHSGQQTADGGYILFGIKETVVGFNDMHLLKTDENGDSLWSMTYGTVDWEWGNSVQQTTDNGYILCGGRSGPSNDSLSLIKTDSLGNFEWNKTYSISTDREVGQSVQQTADGGFIAVGFSGPDFAENFYILKVDQNGVEQWSQEYLTSGRDLPRSIKEFNGGYIILGETNTVGNGGSDLYLMRTNINGGIVWTKTFGTTSDEIGRCVALTSDGGLILVGYEYFPGGNIYVVKTDQNGIEQWSDYYGGTGWDQGHSIQQALDGGYIIGGRKENEVISANDMYCVKTDVNGAVEWDNTFPLGIMSDAQSIQQTADGGYMLFGSSYDLSANDNDFYLVKTNANGIAGIQEIVSDNSLFSIYPNPASSHLFISANSILSAAINVVIYNISGEEVGNKQGFNETVHKIDVGNLAPGAYFIELTTDDGGHERLKFIKN